MTVILQVVLRPSLSGDLGRVIRAFSVRSQGLTAWLQAFIIAHAQDNVTDVTTLCSLLSVTVTAASTSTDAVYT